MKMYKFTCHRATGKLKVKFSNFLNSLFDQDLDENCVSEPKQKRVHETLEKEFIKEKGTNKQA